MHGEVPQRGRVVRREGHGARADRPPRRRAPSGRPASPATGPPPPGPGTGTPRAGTRAPARPGWRPARGRAAPRRPQRWRTEARSRAARRVPGASGPARRGSTAPAGRRRRRRRADSRVTSVRAARQSSYVVRSVRDSSVGRSRVRTAPRTVSTPSACRRWTTSLAVKGDDSAVDSSWCAARDVQRQVAHLDPGEGAARVVDEGPGTRPDLGERVVEAVLVAARPRPAPPGRGRRRRDRRRATSRRAGLSADGWPRTSSTRWLSEVSSRCAGSV